MLAEAARAATASVVAALERASAATGSDFHYLLGTAMRESGLKPQAQNSASSAAGLFQFVEQTWYGLVKDFGAKHGLGSYAGAIARGPDGRLHADNAQDRQAILALRNDPQVSAMMAGEYARQTKNEMQNALGRPVCEGELYAAHFLGADSACKLVRMNDAAPATSAASAFPQAAGANKTVFYHQDGTPKTVREVYDWALNRPSVNVAAAASSGKPAAGAGTPVVTVSDTSNYSDVLALLWSPARPGGFFSGGNAQPFSLRHDLLDILSSTVAKDGGGS
jgi:hypothetical protein